MMEEELILSDMTVLDKRLERLATGKSRGTTDERKRMAAEEELLARLMQALEAETPLRELDLSEAEQKALGGFGLLSLKPLLRVINGADDDDGSACADALDERTMFLRGKLEAEIAQMASEEAAEFLADFGIEEPGLNRDPLLLPHDGIGELLHSRRRRSAGVDGAPRRAGAGGRGRHPHRSTEGVYPGGDGLL